MQRPDHQGTIRTFFNDRREGEPTRNVIHHVRSQHGWLGLTDDPEQMKKFHDDMHKPLQSAPPHGYGPPGHTH